MQSDKYRMMCIILTVNGMFYRETRPRSIVLNQPLKLTLFIATRP